MAKVIDILNKLLAILQKIMRNTQPGLIMNLTDVQRLMRLGDVHELKLDGRIRQDTKEEVFYRPQVEEAIKEYFYSLPKSHNRSAMAIPPEALKHTHKEMEAALPKIRS